MALPRRAFALVIGTTAAELGGPTLPQVRRLVTEVPGPRSRELAARIAAPRATASSGCAERDQSLENVAKIVPGEVGGISRLPGRDRDERSSAPVDTGLIRHKARQPLEGFDEVIGQPDDVVIRRVA
jgi:hypothetical protein